MRAALLVPLLLVVAAGIALVDDEAGLRTWLHLRDDLRQSRSRIDSLRSQNEALRAEAAALEEDPFATERAIREDLGLALPGETLVRFETEPGGAALGLSADGAGDAGGGSGSTVRNR